MGDPVLESIDPTDSSSVENLAALHKVLDRVIHESISLQNQLEFRNRISPESGVSLRNEEKVLYRVNRAPGVRNQLEFLERVREATDMLERDTQWWRVTRCRLAAVVEAVESNRQSTDPTGTNLTNRATGNDPSVTLSVAPVIRTVHCAGQLTDPVDTNLTDLAVDNNPSLSRSLAAVVKTAEADRQATDLSVCKPDKSCGWKRSKVDSKFHSNG